MQFRTTSSLRALLAITFPFLSTMSPVRTMSRHIHNFSKHTVWDSMRQVRCSRRTFVVFKKKSQLNRLHPAHPVGVQKAPFPLVLPSPQVGQSWAWRQRGQWKAALSLRPCKETVSDCVCYSGHFLKAAWLCASPQRGKGFPTGSNRFNDLNWLLWECI